jgi:hypothetical protein
LDPTASSIAAALRLKALKDVYGSWTMALAAFIDENAAIEAKELGGSTDYYSLYFPENVEKTVSLVLAGKILYSDPASYGYSLNKAWPILSSGRRKLDAPKSLRELSSELEIDIKTFKDMNLHILGEIAPQGATINIP